jgi:DNA-binding response OmpR family regulator
MSKKIRIVLIEDDTDDVELLQEALEKNSVSFEMTVLKDGSMAASYLEKVSALPHIIIMDFNLPRVHGREVISLIRANEKFANVPILILSTSSSREDIAFAYSAGADKYLVKPSTIEAIKETVCTILELANNKTTFSS